MTISNPKDTGERIKRALAAVQGVGGGAVAGETEVGRITRTFDNVRRRSDIYHASLSRAD